MTTSPFGPVADDHDDELQHLLGPFGAAAGPVRPPSPTDEPAGQPAVEPAPWAQDPFAGTAQDPFAGTATSSFPGTAVGAPWAASSEDEPARPAAVGLMTPFGLPAAAEPAVQPVVPQPRSASDGGAVPAPAPAATGAARGGSRRRVSPVVAVAVAGGAVVAGALGAFALLGAAGPEDTVDAGTTVAAAPASTPAPTASDTAGGGAVEPSASPTALPTAFAPNTRDPFAALVAAGAAAAPATATGAPAVVSGGGTTGSTTTGGAGGTTTGGTGGGTSTGTTGGTTTGGSGTTDTVTQLSKAQICTAVTDPMNQVEQLLTNSASGATGAVDAGLALRNPVAVLRTAVSLTSDSRLAGRLDIAASTAEALRAQLIAGTAVTSGQVATQVSRDADVRSACA